MKKSSLKDWFKFQVWRQSGGTFPELCDLADIREWLNETADDPDLAARISTVETAVGNVQTATLPTVIELDTLAAYVIEDGKDSIVVVTDGADKNWIMLPKATVGLRVTIINQDGEESATIYPASGEYINGSDSTRSFGLTALNSATFYCYADGYWATI